MTWLAAFAVVVAMGIGFASVFVIDGGQTERPITTREVELNLMKQWPGPPGRNRTATCRPSEKAGYFDCTLRAESPPSRSQHRGARLYFYDFSDVTVPARAP